LTGVKVTVQVSTIGPTGVIVVATVCKVVGEGAALSARTMMAALAKSTVKDRHMRRKTEIK